jgi:hypothetical protein
VSSLVLSHNFFLSMVEKERNDTVIVVGVISSDQQSRMLHRNAVKSGESPAAASVNK